MKNPVLLLIIGILTLASCGKSGHQAHEESANAGSDPNQALYEEVMAVHDEVMPKSGQIYQLKKDLQDKITKSASLSDDRKKEIEQTIAELDSADHAMMDWMHKFQPTADSTNQEAAREYLENEMERIKKVKDLIEMSLQKAKEELEKK
ncbi:MAG: hypothetical protein JSS79_03875 [Bacteroidetes bacterium]|nr:hypothetical protein [Bacteroidota bacterium]